MVRPVQQIEQELAALDRSVSAIASEFHEAYGQYLAALGKAVRQQLILASYHLCTRGYPNQFLNLSLSQRQDLQQSIQRLAKQTQIQLQEQLQTVQTFAVSQQLAAKDLAKAKDRAAKDRVKADAAIAELKSAGADLNEASLYASQEPLQEPLTAWEKAEAMIADLELNPFESLIQETDTEQEDSDRQDTLSSDQSTEPNSDFPSPELLIPPEPIAPEPIAPKTIAQWQDDLERSIVQQLQALSQAANQLLQQTQILPSRLPAPVLEVAAKTDIAADTSVSPPNLLNLLVESETDEETSITQLLTIRLRLAEIEFSDASIGVCRSKIRSLTARLNKLGREYQKQQTEKAIAQAESAWRASWFEET
jgi:hypothetical protein